MSDSEKSAHYNWLDRSAVRVRFDAHPYGARANPGFDPLRNKKAGQTCFFIVNGGAEGDCRAKTIQRNVFAEISSSC